jgi:hypothetical protein
MLAGKLKSARFLKENQLGTDAIVLWNCFVVVLLQGFFYKSPF